MFKVGDTVRLGMYQVTVAIVRLIEVSEDTATGVSILPKVHSLYSAHTPFPNWPFRTMTKLTPEEVVAAQLGAYDGEFG